MASSTAPRPDFHTAQLNSFERSQVAHMQEDLEEKNRIIAMQKIEIKRLTEHLSLLVQRVQLDAGSSLLLDFFWKTFQIALLLQLNLISGHLAHKSVYTRDKLFREENNCLQNRLHGHLLHQHNQKKGILKSKSCRLLTLKICFRATPKGILPDIAQPHADT